MSNSLALGWDIVQICWINILLSGDNAIMIALACHALPDRQRRLGILFGALGAIGLRIAFTLVVSSLLGVPLLSAVGGLFVVVLAAKLPAQGATHTQVDAHGNLMRAVMSIIAADAFMSLDNVLALAAAAKGAWRLIVFGLLLSAPLVMFGAGLLSNLITRFPLLVWAGAAILGWAGGELIAADPAWSFVAPNSRPAEFLLGTIGGAGVLLSALVLTRRTGK